MIFILKLIVLSMTVMMMIDLHSNLYYLGLLMYMYVKCAHSLVQNKGRFFKIFYKRTIQDVGFVYKNVLQKQFFLSLSW